MFSGWEDARDLRYICLMLSYQHMYHAGNLADLHKHVLLAWILDYLIRKNKPLTYIETHAGRGLYDLSDEASLKTGEAAQGVSSAKGYFMKDHPFARALRATRAAHGTTAYPGSPLIAGSILRQQDSVHLGELHPTEFAALQAAVSPFSARCHKCDGFALAHSLCPPDPRRGLMLIDPSYEIKSDYTALPSHIKKITRAWNVGIVFLWYPILRSQRHCAMIAQLAADYPDALRSEVTFASARPEHGMTGSGCFIINPPFGLADEIDRLTKEFAP